MERDFLSTEEAKARLAAETEVPDDHEDKGKARAADTPAHATESKSQAIEPKEDAVEGAEVPASQVSANGLSGKSADSMDLQQVPPDVPMESPFHPSYYPPPWPSVPVEGVYPPITLQRRIPIHLLPKKLYVHDPWNVTDTGSFDLRISYGGKSWTSMTDRVCAYSLWLPRKLRSTAEDASKAAAAAEDEALSIPESILIPPQETEGPTEQPAIRAFLPKRPRKPADVPEAHLYLSPKGILGTGNHSVVYEAELELSHDVFCDSTYCKSCLDEQIKVEVDRLKASGEWERRMNEAVKTYETTEPRELPSSSSDQIPSRHVGFVKVRLENPLMGSVDALDEEAATRAAAHFFAYGFVIKRHIDYEGLVIPIYPNVQWQNSSFPDTICKHQVGKMKPVPRTAKFLVAAKLSLPHDSHLKQEARNYVKFPLRFFDPWYLYDDSRSRHYQTTLEAFVPQFFGYYTPDGPPYGSDGKFKFCSPILLIERCGKPIRVRKLSTHHRQKCLELLYRFHTGGWLHGSFAERNILMQKRNPVCSPLEEECEISDEHPRYDFRLVDFSRSEEYQVVTAADPEKNEGRMLFGLL